MAYCGKCGSEIPDGNKFCSNCGAAINGASEVTPGSTSEEKTTETGFQNVTGPQNTPGVGVPYMNVQTPVQETKPSLVDKFGKFYGIILLILAVLSFNTDPAILTIILGAAIIAGCVFCFARKYKLKIFTIAALIFALISLVCGITQARGRYGLFKTPGKDTVIEQAYTQPANTNSGKNTSESKTSTSKSTEASASANTTASGTTVPATSDTTASETSTDAKTTANGVDPDLKAFLDSYEEFMDEYVAFMKKYMDNPGDALSMLSDYAKMLDKYEDFADQIDKYDSEDMSEADALYYLEVVNRCNMKMLEIY